MGAPREALSGGRAGSAVFSPLGLPEGGVASGGSSFSPGRGSAVVRGGSGLAAGSYRIRRADTPSGYGFSTPSVGYYDLPVSSGQSVSGKNFGAILL